MHCMGVYNVPARIGSSTVEQGPLKSKVVGSIPTRSNFISVALKGIMPKNVKITNNFYDNTPGSWQLYPDDELSARMEKHRRKLGKVSRSTWGCMVIKERLDQIDAAEEATRRGR